MADERFQQISTMANEIDDHERRFRFVYGQVKLIDDTISDGASKSALLKRLVAWALPAFNACVEFKSDERMLYLWGLLVGSFYTRS